jgi:hypothetical protein
VSWVSGWLQLELQAIEGLQTYWKKLRKKEAKAAKDAGPDFVPIQQRPEVTFLPSLLSEFLEVCLAFSALISDHNHKKSAAAVHCNTCFAIMQDCIHVSTSDICNFLLGIAVECWVASMY